MVQGSVEDIQGYPPLRRIGLRLANSLTRSSRLKATHQEEPHLRRGFPMTLLGRSVQEDRMNAVR